MMQDTQLKYLTLCLIKISFKFSSYLIFNHLMLATAQNIYRFTHVLYMYSLVPCCILRPPLWLCIFIGKGVNLSYMETPRTKTINFYYPFIIRLFEKVKVSSGSSQAKQSHADRQLLDFASVQSLV